MLAVCFGSNAKFPSSVQAETFEIKLLHLNIDRGLFLINSVSTMIAPNNGRQKFY